MSAVLNRNEFDVTPFQWRAFGSYTGFAYRLLNVDLESRLVDMLFWLEPERRCFYHTHHQPGSTLVIQREQHISEPGVAADAAHKIRKAGDFSFSRGAETHIEGGGKDG